MTKEMQELIDRELNAALELLATTLESRCYSSMFNGCTDELAASAVKHSPKYAGVGPGAAPPARIAFLMPISISSPP